MNTTELNISDMNSEKLDKQADNDSILIAIR